MNSNRYTVEDIEDNTCTVSEAWITDPSETGAHPRGYWRASFTVTFIDGSDLLQKLQTRISANRWKEVWMSAQDMAPAFPDAVLNEHGDAIDEELEDRRFSWLLITSGRRVYTDTGELTLTTFPTQVNSYCNDCVTVKRRLLHCDASTPVRVELRLSVIERERDTWDEPVNYDGNLRLADKRLGRKGWEGPGTP
jgi:hypothetical protein